MFHCFNLVPRVLSRSVGRVGENPGNEVVTVYISSREGFLVIAANKNKDKHKGIPTEFNFPYTVQAFRLQSRYRFA